MRHSFKLLLFFFPVILITIIIILKTYYSKDTETPLKTSGAMQSLDLWTLQRAYPEKKIPDIGFDQGYNYSKANLINEFDISTESWKAIGPKNISGRTLALEFNPHNGNTIYAGSASGGLWRSYTGGVGETAWENIPTGFPVLSVSSIIVSPADTNKLYIGTGEVYGYQNSIGGMVIRTTRGSYGIGILKSTDNGSTWTKSLDWSTAQSRGVQVLKINPRNSNVIWAGTTEGTYVTYDAGSNWRLVNNTIMVTDIAINPNDTGTVFIACGNLGSSGNGIYRTLNSGNNWEKLTNGLPQTYGGKAILSMYKSSPNVIFASIGFGSLSTSATNLCKSVDNGNTWITVSDFSYATYQGWYSHFAGVNPVDSGIVITGGIDLFKSTDGGNTLYQKSFWNIGYSGRTPVGGPEGPPNYSHADHHAMVFHPDDPDIIYFASDGGVYRTTDGAETFEAVNGGYQSAQFYPGFSSARTDSLFAIGGMQDNNSAIYDGDEAWIRVIGGDGCWTGINYRNKDTLFGSYQGLNILASINGGQNFYTVTPPTGYTTGFVAPFILGNVNPQIMYAGRSVVFKTTNSGVVWNLTNGGVSLDGNNPLFTLANSFINDDVVYAASAPIFSRARIFRTSNGGDNWNDITSTLPDRYFTDFAVDPLNDNIVYCTVSGFGTSHIYVSSNAGANWTDINNGLPDVPTSSVTIDPSYRNIIYLGNDIGVYISTNSGSNWTEFQSGMSDASIVLDLSISVQNRSLRAVTHGRGIFERSLLNPSVGINETTSLTEDFQLYQNYPNPFNPKTKLEYRISSAEFVSLIVYDVLGNEVKTLVNEIKPAGNHSIEFVAGNLPSGIYIYKLITGGGEAKFSDVKKMILIK